MQLRSRRLDLEYLTTVTSCAVAWNWARVSKTLLSLEGQRSFPRAFIIAHKTWMNLVKDYPPIVVCGWRKYHFTVKNVGSVPFIFCWELLRLSGKITNSIIYTLQFKRHEVLSRTQRTPIQSRLCRKGEFEFLLINFDKKKLCLIQDNRLFLTPYAYGHCTYRIWTQLYNFSDFSAI